MAKVDVNSEIYKLLFPNGKAPEVEVSDADKDKTEELKRRKHKQKNKQKNRWGDES